MNSHTKPNSFFQRGGTWVVTQFALMLAVFVLAIVFREEQTRNWLAASGWALAVIGSYFGVAGALTLGQARTAFPKPKESSPLIQHGIYARVRHPLYTAVMLLSIGWTLIWHSLPAFAAAMVQIPFFVAKARREERWLREKFPGYAEYAKRVPAFLPRLRPPSTTI